MYICIYVCFSVNHSVCVYVCRPISIIAECSLMSRKPEFTPRSGPTKDSKMVIDACLTPRIIRYQSRVSGAIQRKE